MKFILFALQCIPAAIQAVKSLEEVFHFEGTGKEKLDIITSAVDGVYEVSKDLNKDLPKDQVLQIIVKVVSKVVGVCNTLGVFKKVPVA